MKIRTAIIGYGVVGKKRKKFIDENSHLELCAISDISFKENSSKRNGVKYFKNYKNIFNEELDAVFICMPNYLAKSITIESLKNNIHVFCEKPPSKNLEELLQIREVYKNCKSIKLKYGFNHRYHESVEKASDIIKSKKFGDIVNVRGVYGKSKIVNIEKGWRSERKLAGGGILLDQGIHLLDLINKFGGKFDKFKSFISNSFWRYNVEDNAFAIMKNDKNNIIASIHSTATQWEHKFSLEITLQKALIILSGILSGTKSYGKEKITIIPKPKIKKINKKKIYQFYKDHSWKLEIDEFAKIINQNMKIKTGSYQDALNVMRMIDKIYISDVEWYKKFKSQ